MVLLVLRDAYAATRAAAVVSTGVVVDLTADLAVAAATISATDRLPMADSVILATARHHGATLWTQDADFAGLDGVRYIAKA